MYKCMICLKLIEELEIRVMDVLSLDEARRRVWTQEETLVCPYCSSQNVEELPD